MFLEYRFYECTPGRLNEELARMHEVAFAPWKGEEQNLFEQYGVPPPIAAWSSTAGHRQPVFGYILKWESFEQRDECFPAFWTSPEWAEVRERTNQGFPMVDCFDNWIIAPSPAWNLSNARPSSPLDKLHEMRIHHTLAGFAPQVSDYLATIEHPQMEFLGGTILGMFDVLIGPDMPAIVSFISWPDFDTQQMAATRLDCEPRIHERRRIWMEEFGKSPIRRVEQTLLRPLAYCIPKANFGISA